MASMETDEDNDWIIVEPPEPDGYMPQPVSMDVYRRGLALYVSPEVLERMMNH